MNETEQLWCDLLHEWHDNTNGVSEPEMSLENQAKYLSKKYPIKITTVKKSRYNSDNDESITVDEDRALVCLKKVIVKYRPHLHMGEYWLDVDFSNGVQNYSFYNIQELESETLALYAQHPHINNGKPCLGTYQGDLGTAFVAANYIQFMSLIRAFLGTYTGNDTYFRGTHFKTIDLKCQLHSVNQINDIFSEEAAESGIDAYSVATDPMRWNWPKDLTAFNTITITGQEPQLLQAYFRAKEFPFLHQRYNGGLYEYASSITNKILGYVSIAHHIGELSLVQSFEFVRVFLLTCKAHYNGEMDEETSRKLEKLASDIYTAKQTGKISLNPRYSVSLDTDNRDEITSLNEITSNHMRADANEFLKHMKWAGDKLTNFVVLLRKQAPHKAAENYLKILKNSVDVDSIALRYKRVRKFACRLALEQVERDKRRFINELNKSEVNNSFDDLGQGTLFS